MRETPDRGSAASTLQALIAELERQLGELPSSAPDDVDRLMAALGDRLQAFAAGLQNHEVTHPADLRRVQILLGNYAGLLSRSMAGVGRGLEVFGLAEPVYRDAGDAGPWAASAMRVTRTSVSA